MAQRGQEDFGALVGWSAQNLGPRVVLNLQTVTAPPPHKPEDVSVRKIMLDRNQAAQLATFLFEITDQTPPAPRRGWLGRMLMP